MTIHRIEDDLRETWLDEQASRLVEGAETYLAKWAAFEAYRPCALRVLVADDSDLFRHSLQDVLAGESRIELVGEACNGEEAVALAESLRPDLILMDVEMPVLDGFGAARAIRSARPEARIVVVSGWTDEGRRREARAAGAVGYLSKDELTGEPADAILGLRFPEAA